MRIQNMFHDDINRQINGVIKVDQDANDVIEQEVREYVITKELRKHFSAFFNYYSDAFEIPTAAERKTAMLKRFLQTVTKLSNTPSAHRPAIRQ